MRFYRKEGPKTPIVLKNGDTVQFETTDGHHGFHATDDAAIIDQFGLCIKQHRGGLEEITQEQYEEFSKKKPSSPPLKQPWREEFGGGPMGDTVSSRTKPKPTAVAAVADKPTVTVDVPAPPPRRNVGKRPSE